jgi:hypothetical protein
MKELNVQERIKFLELFARMAPDAEYERTLELQPRDISRYCEMLDVVSPNEARRLAKRLKTEHEESREARIVAAQNQLRQAEAIAQQRLAELERKRVDINAVREQDAERQRRWAQEQEQATVPAESWELSLEGTEAQRQETIDRFRREIVYRGMNFVRNKYDASPSQIKNEAARLGLKINWEIVRR